MNIFLLIHLLSAAADGDYRWQTRLIERLPDAKRVNDGLAAIWQAAWTYQLDAVFALFSGGHDSLTSTTIASLHPLFAGVIHIDTGTGLRATEDFVRETCAEHGWPLITKSPAITYDMLVTEWGFPGPAQHNHMYRYLKDRPLAQAKIAARQRGYENIGFVTGIRKLESTRRMGHVESMHKDKAGVWVAPIADWHTLDCRAFMDALGLPRNPVKDKIGISGECECGSFASAEELRLIELHYPQEAERIRRREAVVVAAQAFHAWEFEHGFRDKPAPAQKLCRWGHGRGMAPEQAELGGEFAMCYFCKDGLNAEGVIGIDPDHWMMAVKAAK